VVIAAGEKELDVKTAKAVLAGRVSSEEALE
jgi:hypothetical protein